MSITTDRNDTRLGHGIDEKPTAQNAAYLVLSEEERAKGFVRPVRRTYIHRGASGPQYPLRNLTTEEKARYIQYGYVQFEAYPEDDAVIGKFWTQLELDNVGKGCGTTTTMDQTIAETYARDPTFYGATYCVFCQKHLPVAEFRWEDETVLGS